MTKLFQKEVSQIANCKLSRATTIGGLSVNLNHLKTTVYRIGSIKNSNARMYTKNELNWTNEPINVLGVSVSTDATLLSKINYEAIIKKSELTLKKWRSRNLSLLGKVLIVNSLVASLFVYKMSVLPKIPSEFVKKMNKIIESFIWNDRRAKIPIKVLQISKQEGGTGLVNLELKDCALKANWVRILKSDQLVTEFMKKKLSTELGNEIWECNLKKKDIESNFKDSFWRDVLVAWSYMNYKTIDECQNTEQIDMQYIWYNSVIRSNNSPIFYTKAYRMRAKIVKAIKTSRRGNY